MGVAILYSLGIMGFAGPASHYDRKAWLGWGYLCYQ